ncbi:putative [Hydroxymethylglutaryl-CoA reductase (NADPH)] kinase [Helianthus annuus]|nr:putative [Hydroxymethylglutaryl-CoA reductase (NADPH)] kinase [Helianthus annuus]
MPLTTFSNIHNPIAPVSYTLRIMRPNSKTSTEVVLRIVKKDRFLGLKVLKKMRIVSGMLCKGGLEPLEGDSELGLEGEILEFMKSSRNPNDFPTEKELLDAGRSDLVDAIIKKGGWMSLGWNDSDDDIRDVNARFDPSLTSCSSSHQCASSSGRSVETVFHEDAWLEDGHCIYDSSKVNDGQRVYGSVDVDLTATGTNYVEKSNMPDGTDSNDVKSQLQQMKLELTSSLRLLRFMKDKKTNNLPYVNLTKHDSSELQRLHVNEDLNVNDRLKSVCAKLTVLERKLASSIIDAQKLVKKKQMRTDGGCRNLQLHNVCIIWHDSASEVLLVGSVDGWTTQRRMKKSEVGVFYLSFKLYPGRYEYKFIVDGVWRVDPLRPIVNKNGYENNVLTVPE